MTSKDNERQRLMQQEKDDAFDSKLACNPRPGEQEANEILQKLKTIDGCYFYDTASRKKGYGGQEHSLVPGDGFLSTVDVIEQTHLFEVAQKMPKGAHLHIHFNACLVPDVLLTIAESMENMFIRSNRPLKTQEDFWLCEIQFMIKFPEKRPTQLVGGEEHWQQRRENAKGFQNLLEEEDQGSLFEPSNWTVTEGKEKHEKWMKWMNYGEFRIAWNSYGGKSGNNSYKSWLKDKLVFNVEEAHGPYQTQLGAWEKFNGRTRMMKGLFNYRKAFSAYTRLCLESFVNDHIQYAEIRPNFMETNQIFEDDGATKIDNEGTIDIIIDKFKEFQSEAENQKRFLGLKLIYCTPRSFKEEQIETALAECLKFKKQYREYIAGFDLVGEESKGKPLKDFRRVFQEFQVQCKAEKLDIPFLFHCGETLDDADKNLVEALTLGAKRIGHGYALISHPGLIEAYKAQGICLELCPISNEVLGLTQRIGAHSMYPLLANNVHCCLNSDNGTLFRSTLSHDFYQAIVGRKDMTIFGWRQLIEWSIDHSVMQDEREGKRLRTMWESEWARFVAWINKEFAWVHEESARIDKAAKDEKLRESLREFAQKRAEKRRGEITKKQKAEGRMLGERLQLELQRYEEKQRQRAAK
ncbi:uncharacterized protein BCR38DRAFT_411384 [Pseudomassariella vexata]|uniref:Adenosine deaminase domain-containing protein n=1 Tax=Pseudomassariella vexata TaxID=1141098 RepID=A0A1Y2DQM3_9PEZI|nr:uncharacterized protein BCR38DRAFT_411384 [Pseudomassariella vexata]ORY61517.1 hypothetical protein BCR38DRAFT_411384 [Pseudomassariella vexata]